jgi:hypothetical protein
LENFRGQPSGRKAGFSYAKSLYFYATFEEMTGIEKTSAEMTGDLRRSGRLPGDMNGGENHGGR